MSQTGTWCWNVSSGKLVWSEEQYRIFGFDPIEAQPTFQAVLDRIHPEDRPRFEQTRDQALCQGTGFTCEFRIVLPNGIVKHVQGVGRPTVSESGDADEYIGTTADITARKRVEEELRERANLLDLTRDTVFARDPRDVITFWNRGAEEQYGWTSEEAVGRVSHELLQTRFPAPLEEIMAELARVGRWEGELIHLRRNGVQVVVASRWALQLDDQGNPIAVLETNNDVTQRKQAEAEREARRAAEIANQAKSEFLARMSHELRTPLNGILGYAQILRRDRTLGERQLNGVAVIQQSGEHLLTLINDILDLSRIEAGKQDLNLADIPLHTLLRVVSDIIGVRAEQRRLGFVCEAGPDLPQRVRGDERRLRQVLLNLLANAVKFTDRGEVRLRVSFASPRRLRFEVRDTGVGISEDRREAIFQPFAQSGDKGRRTGGAGLGLSISRQLVRLMGGDIHVESRIGEGSTFWFELETSVVNAEIPDVLPERVVTGYLGPRRKILLVDDVAENRALMRDMLAHIGFEVLEAANGSEALEKCRILRPNLILMDTVMPGMDGLEATRRLRRSPDFAGTPIIAVSANASGENETLCLAAGVNAFLPKPLDVDRLMASIGDLLRLEWTYEQNGAELAQRTSSRPLLAPPAQEMETLHRLALLGNMRDIVQHASHLVELDGRYGAFAERLRVLAGGYQSKAILRFVEQHIERIHAP
jgi:PAS domain S-box-containing protein